MEYALTRAAWRQMVHLSWSLMCGEHVSYWWTRVAKLFVCRWRGAMMEAGCLGMSDVDQIELGRDLMDG